MRNSNPQFFLFFFEGIMPTLAETAKPGPVLPSASPSTFPILG